MTKPILKSIFLTLIMMPASSCQSEGGNEPAQQVESNISNVSTQNTKAVNSPKLSKPTPTPTPTPNKPAKIEWKYVGKYPMVQYEGQLYYQLGNGFFADVPRDGNRDSTVHVFVPEQYRANGQTAAAAAASVTCDVERYVGSKIIKLYEGDVIGYQFELKSGTNLLVVPRSRLLKSVVMVQTLPGREPIIQIGEVEP